MSECECVYVCVHRDGQHFTVLPGMYINQCITLTDNYVYFYHDCLLFEVIAAQY